MIPIPPFAPQLLAATVCLAIGFGGGYKLQSLRWEASLKEAADKRVEAVNQAREREHELGKVHETIATTLEKDKQNALRKKDAVIADLRAGTLRLRLPSDLPGTSAPAASPSKCDGASGSELPRITSEFLLAQAARADEIVLQLQSCQAILRADRQP